VTAAQLRKWCLQRPGATEEFPFGEQPSVFKVAGKMFALSILPARPLKVSLKCEPELAHQLRVSYPAIQPGYHLNKRHWNTVTLDGSLPDELVLEMLEDSYDLVVAGLPRKTQRRLGWTVETVESA
jgi:predicted DNA-binding protein (MmcQ/YjbR family)